MGRRPLPLPPLLPLPLPELGSVERSPRLTNLPPNVPVMQLPRKCSLIHQQQVSKAPANLSSKGSSSASWWQ